MIRHLGVLAIFAVLGMACEYTPPLAGYEGGRCIEQACNWDLVCAGGYCVLQAQL